MLTVKMMETLVTRLATAAVELKAPGNVELVTLQITGP